MLDDDNIFFISADFGAPALDKLREKFGGRFINVGIAEQNLINISTGLALEGSIVFAYAIAPFLTMRAYEQLRTNLAIMSQVRDVNVNLIGVGSGLSYDVTGPTHHCLEDACIMNLLPNFVVFSPADHVTAERFVDYCLGVKKPKYIRLDGKAQPRIYHDADRLSMEEGFVELREGSEIGIVATGYMTHKALRVAEALSKRAMTAGVVDVFMLKPVNERKLYETLRKYPRLVTMEESFLRKGSLDTIVADLLLDNNHHPRFTRFGFKDRYVFDVGSREHLHKLNGLDEESIVAAILSKTSAESNPVGP